MSEKLSKSPESKKLDSKTRTFLNRLLLASLLASGPACGEPVVENEPNLPTEEDLERERLINDLQTIAGTEVDTEEEEDTEVDDEIVDEPLDREDILRRLAIISKKYEKIETSEGFSEEYPNLMGNLEGIEPGLIDLASKAPGIAYVDKMVGNHSSDTIIYVPEGYDPSKETLLVYYSPGLYSFQVRGIDELDGPVGGNAKKIGLVRGWAGTGQRSFNQALGISQKATDNGMNLIMVYLKRPYPEDACSVEVLVEYDKKRKGRMGRFARKPDCKKYAGNHLKPDLETGTGMHNLHPEVLSGIRALGFDPNITEVRHAGHSAGGSSIMNSLLTFDDVMNKKIKDGKEPESVRLVEHNKKDAFPGFDSLYVFDGLYPGWAPKIANRAIRMNPEMEINIFYLLNHKNTKHAEGIRDKEGVRLVVMKGPHAAVPTQAFEWEPEDQ